MLESTIRSEAYFAAMLYCELPAQSAIQRRFLAGVERLKQMRVGGVELLFIEPAPFRDAWLSSDDKARWPLAKDLLKWVDPETELNPAQIGSMFIEVSGRLRSPATWRQEELQNVSLQAQPLSFMFRSRPDMLVVTEEWAVWVELEVETNILARRCDGYFQLET